MSIDRGSDYVNREPWVVSAVVEAMLRGGLDSSGIRIEWLIAPGCKPDLVYVNPYMVLIYEAKSYTPNTTCRKQVKRYVEAARQRWPDRQVRGYLVWPKGDTFRPLHMGEVDWMLA